jgi:hypothetical protein
VTAPQPDTRSPGQVASDAWDDASDQDAPLDTWFDLVAAAVLAHDAAQRAARGEVVVDRDCLSSLLFWCRDDHDPEVWTMAHARAALAAPTLEEADR